MPLTAKCCGCGKAITYEVHSGRHVTSPCDCTGRNRVAEAVERQAKGSSAWSLPDKATTPRGGAGGTATRTPCPCGKSADSAGEARACAFLRALLPTFINEKQGIVRSFFHGVRLPLLLLAPTKGGSPHYLKVDFCLKVEGEAPRYFDAKHPTAPQSRDWRRGAAAFEAQYGPIELLWIDERGRRTR